MRSPSTCQQATPSQLERRLRDVAPEELIRRPAPEKWSIAEIVAHLADAELAMGWQTVEEFVRLEAAHDLNHIRQIDDALDGCMGEDS
jgi:hypothetical protein